MKVVSYQTCYSGYCATFEDCNFFISPSLSFLSLPLSLFLSLSLSLSVSFLCLSLSSSLSLFPFSASLSLSFLSLLRSYFAEMDRILADGYVPNEQDVLRSRVQTTGIIETSFKVNKLTYRCATCSLHVHLHVHVP